MDTNYLNFFEMYGNDEVFSSIHKKFISLQDEDIKDNNQHLQRIITDGLIPIMKRNALFNEIYKKIKYAGSFYKGTKVGKPNEYDLDLIVQLPMNYNSVKLETDHEHYGYVKIKVEEQDKLPEWEKHSKILNKWIDNGYLKQNKFREWMESVLSITFAQLKKNDKGNYELIVHDATYELKIYSKSGPAFTLKMLSKGDPVKNAIMSVDIVPSLQFNERFLENYKVIPDTASTFVVIPKPLHKVKEDFYLWRVSFYDQEKQILSKGEFTKMKPVIRILKKFRDTKNLNSIASYFIETLCLHEIMYRKSDVQFFRGPLTGLFIYMLRRLSEAIDTQSLYFLWHEKHNLLGQLDENLMNNYGNRIRNILRNIERKYMKNSLEIAQQILVAEELEQLKSPVSPLDCNLIQGENNIEKLKSQSQDSPSSSTLAATQMPAVDQSVDSSSPEKNIFDAKEIGDELIRIHNIDEQKFDELDIIISALKSKFSPEQITAISNYCKDYLKGKDEPDHLMSLAQLATEAEIFPSHTFAHKGLLFLQAFQQIKKRDN